MVHPFCFSGHPLSASARAADFRENLADPFDDQRDAEGHGDGKIEIVVTSSALWMLAIALCSVFSLLMLVMVCGGAKKEKYQVVVMSDTECL